MFALEVFLAGEFDLEIKIMIWVYNLVLRSEKDD